VFENTSEVIQAEKLLKKTGTSAYIYFIEAGSDN